MSILKRPLKFIGEYIFEHYLEMTAHTTLRAEGVDIDDKYKLYVNTYNEELYCIELASKGNMLKFLSPRIIENLFDAYKNTDDSSIIWALYKKGKYQKNYIFSHKKEMLELIRKDLEARQVPSSEMVEVLHDLYLNNRFNFKDMVKNRENPVMSKEAMRFNSWQNQFSVLAREASSRNLLRTRVYYAKQYKFNQSSDIPKFFKEDFSGVFYSYIDFSSKKVSNWFKNRIDTIIDEDAGEIKDTAEEFERGNSSIALINSILILEDEKNDKEKSLAIASTLGNYLNITFEEKNIEIKNVLTKTPLHSRHFPSDLVVPKEEFLDNFISLCHKADVSNPNFDGTDINGSHINVNLGKATDEHKNKSASSVALGVTGSGKTTSENKIFSQIFGYDHNTETIKTTELKTDLMRDFCVKKSGLPLAVALHKVGVKVDFIKTSLDDFRFNPLNIDYTVDKNGQIILDSGQITSNAFLLSFILEAMDTQNDKVGLSGEETTLFSNLIKSIYKKKDWNSKYIEEIKDVNIQIFNELCDLGYDPVIQKVSEIKEEGYEFLDKPILEDLMREVSVIASPDDTEKKTVTAKSLFSKLEIINELRAFNGLDDVSYKDSKYAHIDFDGVGTKDRMYVPIFIANLLRFFNNDVKNQERIKEEGGKRPYIYYHFAESANIFQSPSFLPFLSKLDNEARSHKIRLFWSTQLPEHLPNGIALQVANVLALFPNGKKRVKLMAELEKKIGIDDEQKKFLDRTPDYGIGLITEHDISIISLNMTDKEVDYYGQSHED